MSAPVRLRALVVPLSLALLATVLGPVAPAAAQAPDLAERMGAQVAALRQQLGGTGGDVGPAAARALLDRSLGQLDQALGEQPGDPALTALRGKVVQLTGALPAAQDAPATRLSGSGTSDEGAGRTSSAGAGAR